MSVVKSKYRGTKEFFLVYAELIKAARYQGVTTYQEIAQIMDLPLRGSHMGREVGQILGEISEDEMNYGRPMLSAVAVGVSGSAGAGFFALARDLGKLDPDADEISFGEAEKEDVYETWERKYEV